MTKKDNVKIFNNKVLSKSPKKIYATNKVIYNHIDEIWSTDFAVFSDYKTTNNKGYRYIFLITDNFS